MADIQIKQLHIKRGNIKAQLTSFNNLLKLTNRENLTKETAQNLKSRLIKVESLFDSFNEIQNEIQFLTFDDTDNYNKEITERDSFYDQYYNLTSIAQVLLSDDSNSVVVDSENESVKSEVKSIVSMSSQRRSNCSIRLPTINLPSFDGTFTDWRSFLDTFNTLIHNNDDLTNVQRLTYLKSAVKGEPHTLISTLESIETNYEIALELLKKRYDNKRRIINNHVLGILNMQTITKESASQLKELINNLQTHINCLRSLNQAVDSWDAILVPIIVRKLDHQTIKEWETKLNNDNSENDEIPQLSNLIEFLTCKLLTLETITQKLESPRIIYTKQTSRSFATVQSNSNTPVCPHCSKDHAIYHCESFIKLDSQAKNNAARKIKLCINCLRKGHYLNECRSSSTCKICNRKHHTLLHFDKTDNSINNKTNPEQKKDQTPDSESTETSSCSLVKVESQTLLSTAVVKVCENNKQCNVRLLLDSASQSNFISDDLCKKLNLKRLPINMNVVGINQGSIQISQCVEITFNSRVTNFSAKIKCLVVPRITSAIPLNTFDSKSITIPANIKLADPSFNQSGPIDLLIGASIFWTIICVGQFNQNNVIFQKTELGWILSGEIVNDKKYASKASSTFLSLEQLNQNLEKFWQVDEFVEKSKQFTEEEEYCQTYFSETTEREKDGKFIVKIPFKENLDQLGDSYQTAKSRFNLLEKRFDKNPNLKAEYCKFINEYINLNHMTKIETNDHENAFYMPHHCVVNENSETTKLRVVFDGSCKSTSGLSINELQYVGPTLQDDIFSIISRFRLYQFVITADIAKMYRQVWVHKDDRRYQRILWREHESEPLSIYELNTITYGTSSAPFLAVKCLLQIADDNKFEYPIESRIINQDFYVDDLITGCNNVNELKEIKQNIIKLLNNAGFPLRKFHSNVFSLTDDSISNVESLNLSDKNHKTLGVFWNPVRDTFSYSLKLTKNQNVVTKRTILAITAQLYDPLGLLAPIIVIAKLIIQDLWQLKLTWDESVPMQSYSQWVKFKDNLHHVNNISVPRKALVDNFNRIELHSFSDASEKAYGACIYLKSINNHSEVVITLLAAKSRVAPLQKVTLPRLELSAAVLMVQLAEKFKNLLPIKIDREYYWCDSQITLCWIKSDLSKWKPYVANRVAEIQRLSSPSNWFYVKSQENPADLISRGVAPELLVYKNIWWQGPQWLMTDLDNNPDTAPINLNMENHPEAKKTTQSFHVTECETDFPIEKFANFSRLQRVTAYCLRFFENTHSSKFNKNLGPLTVIELERATTKLIQIVQRRSFPQELKNLEESKLLDRKSKLLSLTPFLDSKNIIRVGGRLKQSQFTYDKKHPIILPNQTTFSELLLKNEHIRLMHAGPKLMLNSIREKFWPIGGINLAKKIVRNCITCSKLNPKVCNPIMGNLPVERSLAMYPFHSTGVDYAGPYSVKERTGRGTKIMKCYVCLFICFATKALHLELVTNLSTDSFLLSFKRFIARRGKPLNVFSDNGTNFVGANKQLSKLGEFLNSNIDEITTLTSNQGVKWKFIPPRSPNFGGLWEAAVKNVKFHLQRMILNTILTYEEFSTLLAQVESILNSRPLSPLSTDPNDLEPLTPAHFLIGRPYTTIPDPDVTDVPQNRLSRYQLLHQLHEQFWRNWSTEYISQLQQRTKWRQPTPNVNIGALVIMKEDNLPPAQWRLGRIIQLHPGDDGVTRVVTVKCAKGIFKRAVSRVCVLPVET